MLMKNVITDNIYTETYKFYLHFLKYGKSEENYIFRNKIFNKDLKYITYIRDYLKHYKCI